MGFRSIAQISFSSRTRANFHLDRTTNVHHGDQWRDKNNWTRFKGAEVSRDESIVDWRLSAFARIIVAVFLTQFWLVGCLEKPL